MRDDLWIAKFGSRNDRWNHPRVEHGMLALARACGLRVAHSRVETVADRDVLLVRRFDRERADTGCLRHRMVSALTLLRAGDSPVDRANWSYLLLADEVRRASADPRADLRELFGRMCFNAAVSNLDDHPRNHAILATGRAWRLSPAFDLTPSPVVAQDHRDLAMTCGRFGRYANRANLLSGCGRFLLRDDEAAAIFERIVDTVRGEWRPTMQRAGVGDIDSSAIRSAFVSPGAVPRRTRAVALGGPRPAHAGRRAGRATAQVRSFGQEATWNERLFQVSPAAIRVRKRSKS